MGKSVFLKLITERSWPEIPFYQDCRKLAWECQVDSWIIFERNSSIYSLQRELDLWVGLSVREKLEDYTLAAALQGIPFLIPRTSSSTNLLQFSPRLGESYKRDDIREMWSKGYQILTHPENYQLHTDEIKKMQELYGIESYRKRLLAFYQSAYSRRQAYLQRKKT